MKNLYEIYLVSYVVSITPNLYEKIPIKSLSGMYQSSHVHLTLGLMTNCLQKIKHPS
jgi:hypothetical protein